MPTYQASDVWGALGDTTRRAIFELVADGPRSVGDIAAQVTVSRPAVSQHLKVLADAGLVVQRKEGTRRYYAADPAGLGELRIYVERFWRQALESFKATMEDRA